MQLELMLKRKVSKSENEPNSKRFVTIDDALEKAQELRSMLAELGERKHPLAVRKGVEKVMTDKKDSVQLKGAGRTYFLDVEKTREGKTYLRITESRKGEGDKFERNSLNVFPEDAKEFGKAVSKMAAKIAE